MPANPRYSFPDIDFSDAALFADGPPHALFARMRREAPVCWSSAPAGWPDFEGEGYWNLTRAADIAEVSRDSDTFSSWQSGITIPGDAVGSLEAVRAMMIGKDHPEHTRQRKVVNAVFTNRRVRSLGEVMRERTERLLDGVVQRGECDFVADIAGPLPMEVIADLLGVPPEERTRLFRWTDSIFGYHDAVLQAELPVQQELEEATSYLVGLDAERARCPRDDLISTIGQAEVDGDRLALDQRAGLFIQLFAAGVDTTRATLALGVQALAEHPGQRRRLLDDPGLLPGAIEEINRWTSVVMYMRRTALADTQIGGQLIRRGEAVVMWHASANRDPDVIDDPETFDVGRDSCPHQAFGAGGRHQCLGASLARLELLTAFEAILRRLPDLEIDGPVLRAPANWLQSVTRMPVKFTPAASG